MKNPYNYYGGYIPVADDKSLFEVNLSNSAKNFTREHFENLIIELGFRYHIPEIDLIEFYGVKKIREFKKSHSDLFPTL